MFRKWWRNFSNFGGPVANEPHLMGFLFLSDKTYFRRAIGPWSPPLLVGTMADKHYVTACAKAAPAPLLMKQAVAALITLMDDMVQQHKQEW